MNALTPLALTTWSGPFGTDVQDLAPKALERGQVLVAAALPFPLLQTEQALLTAGVSDGKAKNISFDPATGGVQGAADIPGREALGPMMRRYADHATGLLEALLPRYAPVLERARTSYRPCEIAGRSYSWRQDDTRLHVDAFPSRPMRGKRILRVFTNIDPTGKARAWRVGEPFEDMARRFLPGIRSPLPFAAGILAGLGITRGKRSGYDHLMLGLHDAAKADTAYQSDPRWQDVSFAAGTTWLCFTDQVMHAALAGQFALEQTFHVDVSALAEPEQAPLRVLERVTGRSLV